MLEMNYCLCCQQFFICICDENRKASFQQYGKAYPYVKANVTIDYFENWLSNVANEKVRKLIHNSRK
jgi:hypothetical protein